MRPLALFAAFTIVALAPSFLDWQDASVEQRRQFLLYYGVAGVLIFIGSER